MIEQKLLTKRLKEIRTAKKLTLEEVAKLTGFSKGYLSQIENSDQPPPIYTLSRISGALGIDIADLFAKIPAAVSHETIVLGRHDEHTLTNRVGNRYGYAYEDLAPNKRGKNMEPFIVTVAFDNRIDRKKDFRHEGEEFNYVLEGTLKFSTRERVIVSLKRETTSILMRTSPILREALEKKRRGCSS